MMIMNGQSISVFKRLIISKAGLSLVSPVFPLYETPKIAIFASFSVSKIFSTYSDTKDGILLLVSLANLIILAVSGAKA